MGSLDPKMLTFGNFKETYGKLNYEILLLTSLQILLQQRKVYIFFILCRGFPYGTLQATCAKDKRRMRVAPKFGI